MTHRFTRSMTKSQAIQINRGSNGSNDSSSLSDPSETGESDGSHIDNLSIPPGALEPDESDVDDSDDSTPSSQSQTSSEPDGETISRQRNQPSSRARSLRPGGPIQEEVPRNNGGRQGAPNNNRNPAGREGPANNERERRKAPHQDTNHAGDGGPVNENEEEWQALGGIILGVERRIQQLHNECRYRMTLGPNRHPEPRKVMKLIKAEDMLDDLLQQQEWLNGPEPTETPERDYVAYFVTIIAIGILSLILLAFVVLHTNYPQQIV